jgi:hypothetical protein
MFGTPKIYGYTYKGVTYRGEWQREDEEVSKMWHTCTLPNGKEVDMDWSSYSSPTQSQFEMWIDLGMPKRVGSGPLTEKDLIEMNKKVDFSSRL